MYLGKMSSISGFTDIVTGIMDLYTGGAASTMFDAAGGAGGAGGGGGGVGLPMMPSSTTVSPNIQTEISPQISPVFQQTGSGSQSASTSQIAPGGQSAMPAPSSPALTSPGYATPSSNLAPVASGFPDPFYSDFDVRRYQPQGYSATEMIKAQSAPNWIMWGTLGVIVVTGLIVLPPLFRKRKN